MLQVPRKVEYALRAILHLARLPVGERSTFKYIADTELVPRDFMAKVLRDLVTSGLVKSTRGAAGGFELARSPDDITFLEVIEAVDGPIAINFCSDAGEGCAFINLCSMQSVWRAGEEAMLAVFRATSIGDLVERSSFSALKKKLQSGEIASQ